MDFSIDRNFVRVSVKSYAINKINLVAVRTATQKGSLAYISFWIIAGLFTLGMIAGIMSGKVAFGVFALTSICAFLGELSYAPRTDTNANSLLLVTTSGSVTAVTTTVRDEIVSIRR